MRNGVTILQVVFTVVQAGKGSRWHRIQRFSVYLYDIYLYYINISVGFRSAKTPYRQPNHDVADVANRYSPIPPYFKTL